MSLRHILECDFLCSSGTCLEIHDARMYMLIPELLILYNTLVDQLSLLNGPNTCLASVFIRNLGRRDI